MRNPQIVSMGRHYGLTVATCVPADPESKGGSEATVRIASADLVPTDHNLRSAYGDFAELESECESFCERVNAREHRVTRRPPVVMLGGERERMHPLPAVPHTVCFGQTRKVDRRSTISVGGAIYSVPSQLVEERVSARAHGSELIVVHVDSKQSPDWRLADPRKPKSGWHLRPRVPRQAGQCIAPSGCSSPSQSRSRPSTASRIRGAMWCPDRIHDGPESRAMRAWESATTAAWPGNVGVSEGRGHRLPAVADRSRQGSRAPHHVRPRTSSQANHGGLQFKTPTPALRGKRQACAEAGHSSAQDAREADRPRLYVEVRCLVLDGSLPDTATVNPTFKLLMFIAARVVFPPGPRAATAGLSRATSGRGGPT